MSILEDLKKTVSDAADFTVRKTGEVTGTAKLHMEIRAKNAELSKCYEQIGRSYCESEGQIAGKTAEVIHAALRRAHTLSEEIGRLRIRLAEQKGCVICPSCHRESSSQFLYCPYCGQKFPQPPAEEEIPAEDEEIAEVDSTGGNE